MRLHPAFAAFAPLLLLPSCVGAPDQPHATAPAPARPSAPAAAPLPAPAPVEWQDRRATAGNWSYRAEGSGSTAVFVSPANGPMLTVRCDAATRRVSFARAGAGQGVMTVRTSFGAANWPITADGSGQGIASRAATDAVLDQIAYSRGRFAVEVAGLETLILPPWAEIARVVEDCRR